MATPLLSEIKIMSFGFAPKGWALCNGTLLPINQNQALFSLLGTTYGGDGRINFGLPDLQGRTPTHMGNGMTLGERGGEQAHTLSIAEIPGQHPRRQRVVRQYERPSQSRQQLFRRCEQRLPFAGELDLYPPLNRYPLRRQPAAPEHAAVPHVELLDCPSRHFSESELNRGRSCHTLCRRDSYVCR